MRPIFSVILPCAVRLLRSNVSKALVALVSVTGSTTLAAQTLTYTGMQQLVPYTGTYGNNSSATPVALAVDAAGNRYIADFVLSSIVKLAPDGTQTSVGANLSHPNAVTVDASGNVYVVDSGNSQVVKVAPNGTQTTVVSGLNQPAGVAVDATGNIFVAVQGDGTVIEVPVSGPTTIVSSSFTLPSGLAFDTAGNLYVADEAGAVYEIPPSGSPTQIGYNLTTPSGVAVDSHGTIYVADQAFSSGDLFALEGGAPVAFGVGPVSAVATDSAGNLYVTPSDAGTVVDVQLGPVNFGVNHVCQAASTSPAPCSQSLTFTFAVPQTQIFIQNHEVLATTLGSQNLDFTTTADTCIGTFGSGATCSVTVQFRPLLSGTRQGALQIIGNTTGGADSVLLSIDLYGKGTAPQVAFGSPVQKTVATNFFDPSGLAIDSSGNLYIADTENYQVVKGTGIGSSYTQTIVDGNLNQPYGVAVDGAGNVYVADTHNARVQMETLLAGTYSPSTIVSGLNFPFGVAVDAQGNLFIADTDNNQVVKETPFEGFYTQTTVATSLNAPQGVAVDGSGDVFIVDSGNNQVLKETPSGNAYAQTTLATNLNDPASVAVDTAGNVYIADTSNNQVLKETISGNSYIQSTLPAIGIANPQGVAADSYGNVFISDTGNNQVVMLDYADAPSLTFPSTAVGSTSSTQTVTLVNNGNAALSFVVPVSGNDPAVSTNFALTSSGGSACPLIAADSSATGTLSGTVAPGASCLLAVSFAPTVAGNLSGSLTITDNALNWNGPAFSIQTISLSGIATFGPASRLAFVGLPSTILAGGNLGTIHVDIEDIAGDLVTNSTAAVLLFLTGPDGFSQTIGGSAVNGVVTLNLSSIILPTTGSYTLTATSATLSTATSLVTVTPAASKLALTGVPPTVSLDGHLGTIGVSVETANGSVATTSSAPITLTITGPGGYSHTLSSTAASGLVTFNLTALPFTTAGTYTIAATSSGLATATATFTVNPAITTSTVVSSSNLTPGFGSAIELTAKVSPTPPGSAPGTISFYSGTTLLGTEPLTASAEASLSASLPLGLDAVTAIYSGTAGYAASTSSALAISVRATTTISLAASPTTQLFGNPIVVSAQVASTTTGTFTGTITFLDEATVLATVPVGANGLASYSDTTLADGSHKLSASYSGDSDFDPGTVAGTSIAITIADLNLSLGGDNNKTVIPGAAITYNFPLSPLVTPTFIYEVALTASGLPPGATYTFSPANIPAGSGSLPVAFTVQTAATSARLAPGNHGPDHLPWYAWTIGLLPLAAVRRFRSRLHTVPFALTLLLLSLAAAAGLNGCGAGGFFGQATGQTSYTISIHATSGNLVRTSTVQLHFE